MYTDLAKVSLFLGQVKARVFCSDEASQIYVGLIFCYGFSFCVLADDGGPVLRVESAIFSDEFLSQAVEIWINEGFCHAARAQSHHNVIAILDGDNDAADWAVLPHAQVGLDGKVVGTVQREKGFFGRSCAYSPTAASLPCKAAAAAPVPLLPVRMA